MSVQMINFDAGYIWLKVPSTLHVMWDTFISQTTASLKVFFENPWRSFDNCSLPQVCIMKNSCSTGNSFSYFMINWKDFFFLQMMKEVSGDCRNAIKTTLLVF